MRCSCICRAAFSSWLAPDDAIPGPPLPACKEKDPPAPAQGAPAPPVPPAPAAPDGWARSWSERLPVVGVPLSERLRFGGVPGSPSSTRALVRGDGVPGPIPSNPLPPAMGEGVDAASAGVVRFCCGCDTFLMEFLGPRETDILYCCLACLWLRCDLVPNPNALQCEPVRSFGTCMLCGLQQVVVPLPNAESKFRGMTPSA
jgi:hypothetical protein